MGEMVEFPSNGGTGTGYLAAPEAGGAGLGLIVIQEWWGLVPHIEDVCERFAAEGFTALAPDLYRGAKTTEPDEAGKLLMTLNLDQAAKDMGGAIDFLEASDRVRGDGVGVVGFCMGGGLTLMLAAQRPDDVKVAVPFYGFVPWEHAHPDWSHVQASIVGHYGTEDEFFSPEKAKELEATLKELGKDVEFHIYEGAHHAFFNDTRPEVYDAQASDTAWVRTLEILRAKLG
ncbi:MAG: Carboxymethylenebutenolidase [Actinomycetia bacterium]|nr:Carboxymethylenebutenolidase [Actinomycetes bacterium]